MPMNGESIRADAGMTPLRRARAGKVFGHDGAPLSGARAAA